MKAHDQGLKSARTRLAGLREKKPPNKAAQIRALWPEIKAALDEGHSLKAVCIALKRMESVSPFRHWGPTLRACGGNPLRHCV